MEFKFNRAENFWDRLYHSTLGHSGERLQLNVNLKI